MIFYLRKLYFLFGVGILSLCLTCDGRDRVFKTPEAVLIENNLLDAFSERITYLPKDYSEFESDTILNNGLEIKIKIFTDMTRSVLQESTLDMVTHKTYYRERIAEVSVSNSEQVLFSESIDKSFFNKHLFSQNNVLKDTVLKDFSIEPYYASSNRLTINFDYYYPNENDQFFRRKITTFSDGSFIASGETILY